MADDKCITQFIESTKDILGHRNTRAIAKEVRERARRIKSTGTLNDEAAIDQATKEITDQIKNEGNVQTRGRLINLTRYKAASDFIGKFKDPGRGLQAFLSGVEGSKVKGAKASIDSWQQTMGRQLNAKLIEELNKRGAYEAFHDSNNYRDVFREIYDPGVTGNKEAVAIKDAIKESYRVGRNHLNAFGGAIGELPEYIGKQIHSPEKMLRLSDNLVEHIKGMQRIGGNLVENVKGIINRESIRQIAADRKAAHMKAAFEKWSNYILPRLDNARTFEGKDPMEFLRTAFDSIVTGKYDTLRGGDFSGDFKFTGPGNLAKKLSQRRIFHFKDGDSAFEYNARYGSDTVANLVSNTLESMGKNYGMLSKLGVNPRSMFERLKQEALAEGKKRLISRIGSKIKGAEHTFKELTGELQVPIDNMWAKIGMGFRVAQVLSKLGAVTLSSLPDLGLKADQLRANGVGYLDSEFTSIRDLAKLHVPAEIRKISDLQGTYFESLPQQLAHQYSSINTPFGGYTQSVQLGYKVTGITKYDEINRRGFGVKLARNLFLNKNLSWDNLDKQLKQTFWENGIGPDEWDIMRNPDNIHSPAANKKYITPDLARNYTPESIATYLGKDVSKLTPAEINKVREDLEFVHRQYLINNTNNINMLPGARERAMMHQGTDPNTAVGVAWRMVSQFKGFTLSFTRRKFGRFFGNAIENGFVWGDTFTMSDVKALTQMSVSLFAYGYLALAMKDLVAGKTPRDPNKLQTVMASMLQGGSFGIYGDFLLGNYKKGTGRTLVDSIAGPSAETVDDAFDLFTRLRTMDHPGTAAFHLAKSNMPFINLWYAKAAYDYLFLFGMEEKMSPGSINRMKQRMKQEFGQSYIFDPNQYANQF
jgi:hypothetical protein